MSSYRVEVKQIEVEQVQPSEKPLQMPEMIQKVKPNSQNSYLSGGHNLIPRSNANQYVSQLDAIEEREGSEENSHQSEDTASGGFDLSTHIKQPNIEITVKNVDTLQQFCSRAHIELDYLPKLQKWIDKQKFVCEETMDDIHLNVQIFNFRLVKSHKSESDLVREELKELKREKVALMRDFKLFQHYFFSFWKEKARESLQERDYLLEQIVESPQNLFNVCEGFAFSEDDIDFGASTKSRFGGQQYLGFRQPLAFLYHTGNCRSEENMMLASKEYKGMNRQVNGEEWFEVFISGKSFPHHLAHVSSKVTSKKTLNLSSKQIQGSKKEGSEVDDGTQITYFLHRVDLQVVPGAKYTVHTPKVFN